MSSFVWIEDVILEDETKVKAQANVMKAIVMDIDNTFCEKRGGKEYKDLEPYPEVVEQMKVYREMGYKIVLQTARQMNTHLLS